MRRHASGRSGRENDGARPLASNGRIQVRARADFNRLARVAGA
jgi:hypothetical protein